MWLIFNDTSANMPMSNKMHDKAPAVVVDAIAICRYQPHVDFACMCVDLKTLCDLICAWQRQEF